MSSCWTYPVNNYRHSERVSMRHPVTRCAQPAAYPGICVFAQADPEGGLRTFYELMLDQITMPACLMTDGRDPNMFDHFSLTAQKSGVCECGPLLSTHASACVTRQRHVMCLYRMDASALCS
jgi:hypothetical protein